MSYTIKWDPKAKKDFKKLDLKVSQTIYTKVNSIVENPQHFLEELRDIKAYKLRIGNYRVIIDLREREKIIEVILIGHRSTVYKKLKKIIKFLKK